MEYKKTRFSKFKFSIFSALNHILPKFEKALIVGFPNVESSAVEVANYIAKNYRMPVTYTTYKNCKDDPRSVLLSNIKIIGSSTAVERFSYLLEILMSKYVFVTHGIFLTSLPRHQIVTNIWHGVLYKKIGVLLGRGGILADITVGTSELTKKMFSEAFGVSKESVFISGYPRNDILINAKRDKIAIREGISKNFNSFDKIVMWLPTFRKSIYRANSMDGKETGNPFYIENFDVEYFNNLLKEKNCLCIVKPHPLAVKYKDLKSLSNLLFIDDKWISDKGIALYHLVGCSDILISDISSVVIDYLLLDQPIICVSTDFEEYKKTRGFYFDNIEEWLPGPVTKSQIHFFESLSQVLTTGQDQLEVKREELKNTFFTYKDAKSTERLVRYAFAYSK